MKYKSLLSVVVLLLLGLATAYAGNDRRIGTAGAQELRIPFGSRGSAMSGAVVANTSGVESIYWNPAGLATLDGTQAMFTHLPYFADIDVNFVGAATYIDGIGSLGLTVKSVSIGDMEETTAAFPDGTGRVFNPSLTVIGVTYAKTMTASVQFGFTANFINESIFEAQATGVAFDVGFLYDPRWNGLTLGVVMKNYGPEMRFSGRGFDEFNSNGNAVAPKSAKFDLPASINFGVAYNFINSGANAASLSGNFISNNYSSDAWKGGAEYSYNGTYFLRAGYNYSDQNDFLYGFSAGGGLGINIGETRLTFDYAWNETEYFDDNQYFTFGVSF